MPAKHRCSFCGHEFNHGTGMLYVKKDKTVYWFCSKRCRVYMIEHGKDPRKLKWTKFYGGKRRV